MQALAVHVEEVDASYALQVARTGSQAAQLGYDCFRMCLYKITDNWSLVIMTIRFVMMVCAPAV